MAIGMPSIGESGLPAFQRAVLASAAARAPASFIGEGLHHRLARGDGLEAALEIGARRVVAVGELRAASWNVRGL